jgi:glucan phosphoethanolaminetransferase (alkaline phosphatase superfamily)
MLPLDKKLIISGFIGSFLGGFFYQYNILNFSILILIMISSFVSGLYLQKNKNFIEKYSDQLESAYKFFYNNIYKFKYIFDNKKNKEKNKNYKDQGQQIEVNKEDTNKSKDE